MNKIVSKQEGHKCEQVLNDETLCRMPATVEYDEPLTWRCQFHASLRNKEIADRNAEWWDAAGGRLGG
jgi:hypothetical protein